MKIIRSVMEMQKISSVLQGSVGFVPTMGYLHEGHLALVKCSKRQTDYTIVSIYVNPSQFAPNEDFSSYPRDFESDRKKLEKLEVDYLFFPSDKEMYPNGFKTWVTVEEITKILCGKSRPTHFKGVTTIVNKLINITNADYIFMGEKDYQQLKVIEQMVSDLNMKTQVVGCPIIREYDGLAMSSRNKYLNKEERTRALCLYNSLKLAQKEYKKGETNPNKVKEKMKELILKNDGDIDYIEFVDKETLSSKKALDNNTRVVIAVKIGKTRLIDNMNLKGD